uniref:DUF4332 domain-containing protein n=1 Tax=Parastrongyloides trichosuri TaxID=131310 RepID=A0A0N4ZQJ7_PARTI
MANQLIKIACTKNPSLAMCNRGLNLRDDPIPRKYHDINGRIQGPPERFFGRLMNDQPIYRDKDSFRGTVPRMPIITELPVSKLPPEVVETCTPDCTALHCTNECKCAHTHHVVHARCNPPANADVAGHCQSWYRKCPMFHPIQY